MLIKNLLCDNWVGKDSSSKPYSHNLLFICLIFCLTHSLQWLRKDCNTLVTYWSIPQVENLWTKMPTFQIIVCSQYYSLGRKGPEEDRRRWVIVFNNDFCCPSSHSFFYHSSPSQSSCWVSSRKPQSSSPIIPPALLGNPRGSNRLLMFMLRCWELSRRQRILVVGTHLVTEERHLHTKWKNSPTLKEGESVHWKQQTVNF